MTTWVLEQGSKIVDKNLLEEVDSARVVHARCEYEQQVVQQQWLVVQVELQRFVVQLNVRHLRNDLCQPKQFPDIRCSETTVIY